MPCLPFQRFNPSISLGLFAIQFGLASAASAQPMADQLPATTLIYSGWSPSAALQDTLPARMLTDERLVAPWKALVGNYLQAAPLRITHEPRTGNGAEDAQEIKGVVAEHLQKLLADASQCEGCFALLEIKHPADGPPNPQAILVLNLGAKRADFEAHFKPIHQRLKNMLGDSVHMMKIEKSWIWSKTENDHDEYFWGFVGDRFVFYYGDEGGTFLNAMAKGKPETSLATADAFTDCLGKIPGDSIMTTYVNVPPLLAIARIYLDTEDPNVGQPATRQKRLAALGLDNLKSLGEKTSIHDQQFVTQTLLRTDGAPRGFLTTLIQPAVDDALLKCVPLEAMAAVSIRFDPAKTYEPLKAAIAALTGKLTNEAFTDFEKEAKDAGMPVQDILASLGDQWVLYNSDATGGMFLTGWTLVGTLKDVDGFNQQAARLSKLFQEQKAGQAAAHSGTPGVGALCRQYVVDGQTIHYFVQNDRFLGPYTAPAWAQVGDKLVVGIFPQIVEDAVRQMSADKSLLDNPQFQAARKLAGHEGPMVFIAGRQLVKDIYPIFLLLTESGLGPRNWFTYDPNETGDPQNALPGWIPPMGRLLQYVGNDTATVKLTADGILHTRCIANPLLSPFTLIENIPLMTALAIPWMHHEH